MWQAGEFVALSDFGSDQMSCVVIDRINATGLPILNTPRKGQINPRIFNLHGREMWTRPPEAASHLMKLTPEIESVIARHLILPAIGTVWSNEVGQTSPTGDVTTATQLFRVVDHANVGSNLPEFIPTVIYEWADPAHGTGRICRTLPRWSARMKPAEEGASL